MYSSSSSSHFEHLKNLWSDQHREIQKELSQKHSDAWSWLSHHTKNAALGSVALASVAVGTPAIGSSPAMVTHIPQPSDTPPLDSNSLDPSVFLIQDLAGKVPEDVRPLTHEEEENITSTLSKRFDMKVMAELEGKRLNTNYGYIGAEQHLMRYPGDTIATHFSTHEEAEKYARSGMAPGRGAWGYFTSSSGALTQKDIDREKYYLAVQTFLSPGFMENVREQYAFYKYRKMLIVNPDNGRAMVVVIGDAGPAAWTGKSLGGSPEVMSYLKRADGRQKGPVLYFFIDDPEDKIPLGPVNAV